MLTEKEAWLKIAEIYTGPRNEEGKFTLQSPTNPNDLFEFNGVCCGIFGLNEVNFITKETLDIMLDKMEVYGQNVVRCGLYFWPINEEGDKQRIKFCLERAAEL
jgi:hypothetical protein